MATNLNETAAKLNTRIEILNQQISTIDRELIAYNKLPTSRKASQKSRALTLLNRKKTYEKQRIILENQSNNLWTVANTLENVNMQRMTFDAIQAAQNQIKQNSKDMNIDKTEDLVDDIHDYMEDQNEINGFFSRSTEHEDINDIDLEAELANLAEEEFDIETNDFHAPSVPVHSIVNQKPETNNEYGLSKHAIRD